MIRVFRVFFLTIAVVLIALMGLFVPQGAFAQKQQYAIELEWEPIKDAVGYELELRPIDSDGDLGKAQYYKKKNTRWRDSVVPSRYRLRIRTYDERSVPGPWSEPQTVVVTVPPPKPVVPKNKAIIKSVSADEAEVQFRWQPVPGVSQYRLDILDEDGKVKVSKNVDKTTETVELAVAENYSWRVLSLMDDANLVEPAQVEREFSIIGGQLKAPNLEAPENEYVQKIEWDGVENAETYTVVLLRKKKGNKWTKVIQKKVETTEASLPANYQGGNYRILVKANAPLRQGSKTSKMDFELASGDRSPAEFKKAQMREIFTKPTSMYAIASYFVTSVDYRSENAELASATNFSAIGGTGRVGFGVTPGNSEWGGQLFADLSGFSIGGSNVAYATVEGHVGYNRTMFVNHQLRASGGAYVKEVPEVFSANGSDDVTFSKTRVLGSHLGLTYSVPVTGKLGLQANARYYLGFVGLKTPNDEDFSGQNSLEFGLLGFYKFKKNLVGLVGYAYRQDGASYAAIAGDASNPDSTSAASAGDLNEVQITGHYLNLILEWNF